MIIDTNSRISPGLLQTPQSWLNKTAARAKSESPAAASPESDTSASQATLAAQNIASAISPIQDAQAAQAAIRAARQSFFANPASALLAQANQLPENALQLLQ
jgi:hypothetical protein